jgi:hypothetical protein
VRRGRPQRSSGERDGELQAGQRLVVDVEHHGRILRCEWHSKLRPEKNRIHFAKLNDQTVFIGIFVKHLPT